MHTEYDSTYCCLCYEQKQFSFVSPVLVQSLMLSPVLPRTHWLSHWCTTETAQLTSVEAKCNESRSSVLAVDNPTH